MVWNNGGSRVLVVDDVDEMRTVIRRLLTTHGYQVDVASTLAEARSLAPATYDAVIVDVHLGTDRGLDLIETLRAEDPAAARRCLVITGGLSQTLPGGVPHLVKPFRPDQLLAAVQGLSRRDTTHTAEGQADGANQHHIPPRPSPGPGALSGDSEAQAGPDAVAVSAGGDVARPEPDRVAALAQGSVATTEQDQATVPAKGTAPTSRDRAPAIPQAPTGEAIAASRLLALVRRRRSREGAVLADFIHDGPIQQLAAATLAVHMVRRQAPPSLAESLDETLHALNAAARSVRLLVDRYGQPFLEPATSAAVIQDQTAWLLAEPLSLDVHQVERLAPADVGSIADVLELMLLAAVPAGVAVTANAAVATTANQIEITLAVGPVPSGGFPSDPAVGGTGGDAAAVRAALSELACVLGTDLDAELASGDWRARIVVPRQAPA